MTRTELSNETIWPNSQVFQQHRNGVFSLPKPEAFHLPGSAWLRLRPVLHRVHHPRGLNTELFHTVNGFCREGMTALSPEAAQPFLGDLKRRPFRRRGSGENSKGRKRPKEEDGRSSVFGPGPLDISNGLIQEFMPGKA